MWAFLIEKGAGVIAGIIGKWRIIVFVSSIVAGVYAYHVYTVSQLENNVKQANEQIGLLKIENQVIKLSNKAFEVTQEKYKKANEDCVLNNLANEKVSKQALKELEKSKDEIDEKYKNLKNKHVDSECGNTLIDAKLL